MSKEGQFTIEMQHLQGYEFRVNFGLESMGEIIMDEPEPLGEGKGPNPSRALAAAAANCLSASLLYCVSKNEPPAGSIKATATCTLARNEKKRLRIGGMQIQLQVDGELEQAVRMKRCLDLYEDFCVVTASLRDGFPIDVDVVNEAGEVLHSSND
ncbi:MAG: OsmC family protein [Sedimenticola sp.]